MSLYNYNNSTYITDTTGTTSITSNGGITEDNFLNNHIEYVLDYITKQNLLLHNRLTQIESMLYIISRDVERENKYPRLKQLYKEYEKTLDQYKIWEELQK